MYRTTLPTPSGWDLDRPLAAKAGRLPHLRFVEGTPGGDPAGGGSGGDPASGGTGDQDSGDDFKSEHSKQSVLADLAAAREEAKTLKAQVAAFEDANKTTEQKATEAAQVQADAAAKAIRTANQYEAAEKAGLPLSWAKRLAGDTPEELAADAALLKKDVDAQASAGHRTDGAGTTGDKADPVAAAPAGESRLAAYYANQSNQNK
ncbi:MAG: hypothetical protein QM809_11455 [Gordonia sp. (in: high G+C Gram-positive bacteria)]|uniref:hypothetical protein n=1 Tax=Gordonia sp. (in: high G+C Gram-positive bacteria) TaxID=84139 RepID=UPI0039E314AC